MQIVPLGACLCNFSFCLSVAYLGIRAYPAFFRVLRLHKRLIAQENFRQQAIQISFEFFGYIPVVINE
jgi:hypothetical protein